MPETLQAEAHRLPREVRPLHYHIHLHADPDQPSFRGSVRLQAEVEAPTDALVLHARELTPLHAVLVQDGKEMEAEVGVDAQAQTWAVRPPGPLARGPLEVRLEYEGQVGQGMEGLYLSRDGEEVCLATQCEATDARAILPCLDEPDRKAVFEWTVTAPKDLVVLTNGTLRERVEDGAMATWGFHPTAPMSTYLLATCIGRFAANEEAVSREVPMRVWALGGKERMGDRARDLAVRLLPWYEDYFGQPYAFGKYDQVAVPSFAFGAMENAGLVVFRPSLVLLDPRTAGWDDEKAVALVVAHEFAHMWFGDLVTMKWWDDLWLNEAFAEWVAHKAADDLEPGLDVWHHFRQRASSAMSTDALERTHAIYHPVQTPEEAAEMFDAVTYGKGSAVMRMLEQYLGEDAFRAGLRSYMEGFRFGNAKGSDLWHHLGEASGQDVEAIMRDWVLQPGHPAVACTWDGSLHLRQQRARSSPGSEDPALWRVPMVVRYEDDAGQHTVRHLLDRREDTLALSVEGELRWLWPNAEAVGFYRSRPDEGLLERLLDAPLTSAERIALLRDLWMDVRAGDRDVKVYLKALGRLLAGNAPYDVVQHDVGRLRDLEALLESEDRLEALASLRAWVARRLGPAYRELGPEPTGAEDPPTRERRAALLRAVAGIGGDEEALAQARDLAARERVDPGAVDPDVAGTAVAVEAIHGDLETLETHLSAYECRRSAHAAPQDVERYLYTLPAFRRPELVEKVLGTLASGTVAAQAVGPILRSMLVVPHAQRAAWQHVKTQWEDLVKQLGEAWVAILVEASGELPVELADDVVGFYDQVLQGMAGQAYGRAKERLEERAGLLERILPDVEAWAKALD